jgi:hypothetical protein
MASTTHKAYTQSIASALTTELDALANAGTSSASGAIDNTTNLDLFMDLELHVAAQGSARATGASVEVYMVMTLDATNYGDAIRSTAELVAVFSLDAATTARYVHRRDIPIPPANFKLFVYNNTGQALAATSSALKYRTHSVKTV